MTEKNLKYYSEQEKRNKYVLLDSIYKKYKNRQNLGMVLEMKAVSG